MSLSDYQNISRLQKAHLLPVTAFSNGCVESTAITPRVKPQIHTHLGLYLLYSSPIIHFKHWLSDDNKTPINSKTPYFIYGFSCFYVSPYPA